MEKRVKNIIANLASLCFGLVITFLIAEFILRIHNPLPATVKGNKIILRANARTIFKNETNPKLPSEIYKTSNSLGWRGPNPPKGFDRYYKIFTVGGSTTLCYYSSDKNTWTYLLHEKLRQDMPRIWVNNAGIDGHTTYGHILLLYDHLIKMKPDMVIFLVGLNDIGLDTLEEPEFSFYANEQQSIFKRIKSFLYKSEVIGFMVNISRLIKAKKAHLEHDTSFDLEKLDHHILDSEFIQAESVKHMDYLRKYKRRLLKLITICERHDIEAVFLTQSALFGDTTDPSTGINLGTIMCGNINGAAKWKILEMYNNVLREICAEKNIHLIDLALEMPKDSKYYYDLVHFTEEGNRKISEIIAPRLKDIIIRDSTDK